jgi:hypothetical protein
MSKSKSIQDHGYKWIAAWGRYLNSGLYYIQQECDRAREHGVPPTVTRFTDKATANLSHSRKPAYKDDPTVIAVEQGYWCTIDTIADPLVRAALDKFES